MRISKLMAVGASSCALAAAIAIPATAGPGHAAHPATHGTLHSTISRHSVHNGTKVTLHVTGAKKKTTYDCLFAVIKGASANGPDYHSLLGVKSSKKGTFSCTLTFHPFKATVAGKTRHCPLTKSDKKAHIVCGFAAADPFDQKSNAFWPLKASK